MLVIIIIIIARRERDSESYVMCACASNCTVVVVVVVNVDCGVVMMYYIRSYAKRNKKNHTARLRLGFVTNKQIKKKLNDHDQQKKASKITSATKTLLNAP